MGEFGINSVSATLMIDQNSQKEMWNDAGLINLLFLMLQQMQMNHFDTNIFSLLVAQELISLVSLKQVLSELQNNFAPGEVF